MRPCIRLMSSDTISDSFLTTPSVGDLLEVDSRTAVFYLGLVLLGIPIGNVPSPFEIETPVYCGVAACFLAPLLYFDL